MSVSRIAPILVTGANRGLGLQICKAISKRSVPVIASGRLYDVTKKTLESLEIAFSDCKELDFSVCDIRNINKQLDMLPELSGIIHCASPFTETGILESPSSDFSIYGHFFANNLALAQVALKKMKRSGGRVVLIGSVIGSSGRMRANYTPYCIYKNTLQALAEGICNEGYKDKITGTYINLGTFREDIEANKHPKKFLKMSEVVERTLQTLFAPPEVRIERSDLLPLEDCMETIVAKL